MTAKTRKVLRFYGGRELAAGPGILSQSKFSNRLAVTLFFGCEKIVLKPN
jgi:hypothetical protein